MSSKELDYIINYLDNYNQWRRGVEKPTPNPIELGKVIDKTINYLITQKKNKNYELFYLHYN